MNGSSDRVYISVLTDIACAACVPFDGRDYPSIEATLDQFPEGRNKDCLKGDGCTCSPVLVGGEADPLG